MRHVQFERRADAGTSHRAGWRRGERAFIRDLVHQHPACLPIIEMDAMFSGTVSIGTALNTPAHLFS